MSKISGLLLRIFGWKCVGTPPDLTHCVLIVAPHTSNWDFILGILFKVTLKLKLQFFGKDSLFKWYNAWFFKFFGGMPVIRTSSHNAVTDKVNSFKSASRFWLAMAPEGTRAYSENWRSGFYYIALKAEVPLVLVYIDAKTKTVGIGPVVNVSGNIQQDMDIIRDFYKNIKGIKDHLRAPIRLKDELQKDIEQNG